MLADRLAAQQHVDVAQHLGVLLPRNARVTRRHARGQNHLVKFFGEQSRRIDPRVEPQRHAGLRNALAKVAQGLRKLFFAWHQLGHIELAANLCGGVVQRDRVAALGQRGGGGQASRPGAHHGYAFFGLRDADDEVGFMPSAWVHQATGQLAFEGVV